MKICSTVQWLITKIKDTACTLIINGWSMHLGTNKLHGILGAIFPIDVVHLGLLVIITLQKGEHK